MFICNTRKHYQSIIYQKGTFELESNENHLCIFAHEHDHFMIGQSKETLEKSFLASG